MSHNSQINGELVPHLFRVEFTKMTAVLCRLFGLKHIEMAEDIAGDTFMKAVEIWGIKGVPENPTAWLYTVAKNKTRDLLKKNALFEQDVKVAIRPVESQDEDFFIDFTVQNMGESQLEMIFAVCDPVNSVEAQVCLALQILCGFSIEEIANAFLSKKETIKKKTVESQGKPTQWKLQAAGLTVFGNKLQARYRVDYPVPAF